MVEVLPVSDSPLISKTTGEWALLEDVNAEAVDDDRDALRASASVFTGFLFKASSMKGTLVFPLGKGLGQALLFRYT